MSDAQFLGDRGAQRWRCRDLQAFRGLAHADPRNRCDSSSAETAGWDVSIFPRAGVELHCRLALLGERDGNRRGIGDREEVARLPRRQHAVRDRDIGIDEPGNVYTGMHALAPLQGGPIVAILPGRDSPKTAQLHATRSQLRILSPVY
jgi:hypothetical protein